MFRKSLFALLACGLAYGVESFEGLPHGALTSGAVEYGSLSAAAGNAEIYKKARTGGKSLRVMGGAPRVFSCIIGSCYDLAIVHYKRSYRHLVYFLCLFS